jgi:hypothetical protein
VKRRKSTARRSYENDLFFHRFRPANSTYLFGFRKHEQGQNAKEMADLSRARGGGCGIDRIKRTQDQSGAKQNEPSPKPSAPATAGSQDDKKGKVRTASPAQLRR